MFWMRAFSCQLSRLIANEPPFFLCGWVCSCLSHLGATRTYLSFITNIFLHPGQKPSPQHPAKPHLFRMRVACLSVAVCLAGAEESLPTDAPLPVFSLEPGSGIAVRKVGCRWFGGRTLLSFCFVSSQDSRAFLPCEEEERVCVHVRAALCMLKAGGKFSAGYKRLRNVPVWCEAKQ